MRERHDDEGNRIGNKRGGERVTIHYGTCSCGRGLAMHRATMNGLTSEWCARCIAAYDAGPDAPSATARPMTAERFAMRADSSVLAAAPAIVTNPASPERTTYGRRYHEQRIDTLSGELAGAIANWDSRNREQSAHGLASRLRLLSWSLAAEAAALARIAQQDRR